MNTLSKIIEALHGKYVYLLSENYLKKSGSPAAAFNTAIKNLQVQIERKNSVEELEELSRVYNNGRSYIASVENTDSVAIQKAIYAALTDKFGIDIDQVYELNFETGNVSIIESSTASLNKMKKIKHSKHESTNSQTILKRLDKVKKLLLNLIISEKDIDKKAELRDMRSKVKLLEDTFLGLLSNPDTLKNAKEALKEAGIRVPNKVSGKAWQSVEAKGKRVDNQTADAFVRMLNGIVAAGAKSLLANITGAFQEYLFLAIKLKAEYEGKKLSDEYVKVAIEKEMKASGDNQTKGKVVVDGDEKILKALQEASEGMLIKDGDNSVHLEIDYNSQQKMDVKITIENKEYPISVKSYSGVSLAFKGITLQSGSPLATYLFGSDNINRNLSTHYLNILASHTDEDSKFKAVKAQGLQALLLTMLYQSLSGKMLGKGNEGSAEVLAINNNSTGETNFYDINTIVSKLGQRDDLLKYKLTSPDINTLKLNNKKVRTTKNRNGIQAVQARVGKVLEETYTKKMTVMLLPSLIKDVAVNKK